MSSNVNADGRKAGEYDANQAHTILCEAVKSDNNLGTVLALINAGTMVDDPKFDFSPLMLAAQHGSTEVMKALIKHGASVDRCNARKETCMFIACQHKQWDAAKLLYVNGAKVTTTNIDGKSAFTAAKENHGVALLQYMAKRDVKCEGVHQMLLSSISLSDACKYGYDLVANNHDTDSLGAEEIADAERKKSMCVQKHNYP